ncbi:MAG TPA: EAL domain-containing protein [Acidimicrobiales bacterium]|nr:EAL domain-containing protein [Acidimicrobiales bacterium]
MGTGPAEIAGDPILIRLVAGDTADLQTVVSVEGAYEFASVAGAASFGWVPADLLGEPQASFTHPDDESLVNEAHRDLLAGDTASGLTVRRFRCRDGSYRWTECRSRVAHRGAARVVVSSVRDIAERRASELELQRRAATDPLTGLANRTVFMDRLRHALRRLDRHRGLVGVVFIDLDRFTLVNDSLGHHVGDAVLVEVAERLLRVVRPQDTLARLGGDEFAVVAEDLGTPDDAISLGARIIEEGQRPFVVGDEQFVCTVSAGIAVTGEPGRSPEQLLREADLALYRAKDRGRDRADVFDESLRTRAVARLATERMLRRAIDEDRLEVHYQPIIDLATGRAVAAEALVRVWDADGGAVTKAEAFIGVAEETDLLATIDDWVMREVIGQGAAWRQRRPPVAVGAVAINVTSRHLADAGFARSVIDDLADRRVPADFLQIEVTERILMDASNSAMSSLETLREAGVKVGLDDFGTGYSSLSYLRVFPLDFVKIDRSFVAELTARATGTGTAIVASVVHLSHALGMEVVAEGVETAAQAEQLATLGCDRAQGHFFAEAGPALAIEALFARQEGTVAGGALG